MGCSRAVVGVQSRFGIDGTVFDQCLALTNEASTIQPRPQADDLTKSPVLQDAGKHGIAVGAAGEVADDSAGRNAVGRTQHEVYTSQKGSYTVGVTNDVERKRLDCGVRAKIAELPLEHVDFALADVPGVAEVTDEVASQ